eukprot:1329208-Rhodomonas_salina.3
MFLYPAECLEKSKRAYPSPAFVVLWSSIWGANGKLSAYCSIFHGPRQAGPGRLRSVDADQSRFPSPSMTSHSMATKFASISGGRLPSRTDSIVSRPGSHDSKASLLDDRDSPHDSAHSSPPVRLKSQEPPSSLTNLGAVSKIAAGMARGSKGRESNDRPGSAAKFFKCTKPCFSPGCMLFGTERFYCAGRRLSRKGARANRSARMLRA